jgi:DNA (cytosine-5)-methyltransferase 1
MPIVVGFDRQRRGVYAESGIASTLTAHEGKEGNDIVCAAVDCRNGVENEHTNGTLQAKSNGGTSLNLVNVVRTEYIVRRLTPTECERLQGFPDGWTDIGEWVDSTGKKRITSDSARYKALGNSIAIPPWLWVCSQIGKHLGDDKTMASLFDGIGGFPLIWSFLYGNENCVWASEIEEFPIAVTKARFPDGV